MRNIFSELRSWARKAGRKPLVIRGARQVGKTTAINSFGAEEFEQVAYLNLERAADASLFTQVGGVSSLLKVIEVRLAKKIIPGKTLLFLDEIQDNPVAMQQLRYFYEEMPELHVIATGSLLEAALFKKKISIPVGRVEVHRMYPLTFDEFLEAKNNEPAQTAINEITIASPPSPALHAELISLFMEYAFIGGMPEPAFAYAQGKSLLDLAAIYESLLTTFRDDVLKYASDSNAVYLRHVIDTAPRYAGKQIAYNNFAESNYRSREISLAFDSLDSAMITHRVFSSRSYTLPLVPNHRKAPKILFLDVGLCNYKLGQRTPFRSFSELENNFQGQISEQIVGQTLLAMRALDNQQLLYWYRDKRGSMAEVDYLVALRGEVFAIEVKAGKAGTLKSLLSFADETGAQRALRIYSGELKQERLTTPKKNTITLLSVPFYLLHRADQMAAELIA